LSALAELVEAPRPDSLPAVRAFLERYRERLLTPVELPAIQQAYNHATRGEVRELIALDRRLRAGFGRSAFAEASRHVGRLQLRRLRPLRDRTLQRYLEAVDRGEATGWHVVVFGLLLAVFALPLRTGLAHYATRTQQGLLDSATRELPIPEPDREQLRRECDAPVGRALEHLLPAFAPAVVS
jgi:urease accessory protein UreF